MFVTIFQARPPGIYKQDYLQELFHRYGDVDDTPPAPVLPDWCDGRYSVHCLSIHCIMTF